VPFDSKSNSELELLTAIERGEVVTQMTLTTRIGVSIGLINALLKRGMHKGYVKARKMPFKRYAYYVTPKGFSEKSRLVAEYLENSLAFFRRARSQYAEVFERARKAGLSRLVLVGTGELAEIAVLAAWGEGVPLQAIIDPEAIRNQRYGLRVIRSLDEIGPVDAVVITESRAPQKAYEDMLERFSEAQVLAPALLKITRDRADLIAAAREAEQSS
jgi:DNA-binding MarR family transcriptional regulator